MDFRGTDWQLTTSGHIRQSSVPNARKALAAIGMEAKRNMHRTLQMRLKTKLSDRIREDLMLDNTRWAIGGWETLFKGTNDYDRIRRLISYYHKAGKWPPMHPTNKALHAALSDMADGKESELVPYGP